MRTPKIPLVVAALLLTSIAGGEILPAKGRLDSRIRTALYSPEQIYKLHGFVGFDIELIFEEGEAFAGRAGGDLEGVTIEAFENQVHLKPKATLVNTNLVIYTNRRAYRFDYTVHDRRPNPYLDEVMYAVRFTYPSMTASVSNGPTPAEQVERSLRQASEQRRTNFDYWFCGNRAVRPLAVSDDGVHTRLTFAARTELPVLFVRNDDGSESLLNLSIHDGDVVIHRVARRFIVRRGALTGCIVNKGFIGPGTRLETGTVSPHVERRRREVRP